MEGDKAFDAEFLRSLPHESGDNSPGWYQISLWNILDADWWRDYVGRSTNLRKRWRSHERAVLDNRKQPLLYALWRGGVDVPANGIPSRTGKVYRLGSDESGFTDDFDKQAFYNMGEIFFGLIFQTFQPPDLCSWLPEDVPIRFPDRPRGLNVSVPVADWHNGTRSISSLWASKDPVVRAYAAAKVTRNLVIANVRNQEQQFKGLAVSRRKVGTLFTSSVLRDADPTKGEPTSVHIKCRKCGSTREDNASVFVDASREYVARYHSC